MSSAARNDGGAATTCGRVGTLLAVIPRMMGLAQYGTALVGVLLVVGVACGGAADSGDGASAGTGGSPGNGGSGAGGSQGSAADASGGMDSCMSCVPQGSDLSLLRQGALAPAVKDNQFESATITRDTSGALVLSGSFYVGCDGCGGLVSDHTVTIPPTVLSQESATKLAELISAFEPQPCLPIDDGNCDSITIRMEVGGCTYWDKPWCDRDRRNQAQLNAAAAYIDSLGLAILRESMRDE